MNLNLNELLSSIENKAKNACTPKPYVFNLIKDIYDMGTSKFWKKYQKEHPYIHINFFDEKGNYYKLIAGELI